MTALVTDPQAPIPTPATLLAGVAPAVKTRKSYKVDRIGKYGKVEGLKEFSPLALPFERQIHHLDPGGRCLYLEHYTREFSKPTLRYFRYLPDQAGVHDAIWVSRYGDIENYRRYMYDPLTGLLVVQAQYGVDGKLSYSVRSAYDRSSNLIEETWVGPDQAPLKQSTYAYDAKGRISGETQYDGARNRLGFHLFSYDPRGNLVERAWHDAEGRRRSQVRYKFDKSDRLIQLKLLGTDGGVQVQQDYTYDAKHNVVREVWQDRQGNVLKDLRF